MDISCLSSEMVHPSSHETPNDINGAFYTLGGIWVCLACFLRPGSWSVAIFVGSIVFPSSSLAFIEFTIFTGAFLGVDFIARCIFASEY